MIDNVPLGKRLVSEPERLKTMMSLKLAKKDLVSTLETIPIARHGVNRSPQFEKMKVKME